MNMELTLEQSKKADSLLKSILKSDGMTNEEVYTFFRTKDESYYVCKILERGGLINFLQPTEASLFSFITLNEGVETFLKSGGFENLAMNRLRQEEKELQRATKENELMDLDIQLKRFETRFEKKFFMIGALITILNFMITVLTIFILS